MGLKTFTIDFAELSKRSSVRGDFRFVNYFQKPISYKFSLFKDYIIKISNGKDIAKENYVLLQDSEVIYPTVNNIKATGLILDDVTAIDSEFSGGYYIDDNDIVLTRSGTVGLTKCWNKKEINEFFDKKVESIPSGYLIVIKPDQEKVNPKFAEYYFNSSLLSEYFLVFGVGKSQRNIAQGDIKFIPFPLIPKSTQDQIVAQIEPIEKNIKKLKSQVKQPQEIINKVFAREFGFDLEKFEDLKKEKFFEVEISRFNTPLIRSTVIQNNYKSGYLKKFLKKNMLFLKDIIIKPIKRGKQPEYTEEGVKVIKTLNIKNGYINFDEVRFVSDEFFKKNEEKAGIYQNDLLLTSTGMGRGKFALYNEEEFCFADSHISIIRFNQKKTLPYFLNYYCQSFFGIEQLKYIETHIKGTPEIYEAQLNYFQILDISLKDQQKIVDEIKAEIDKQEEINKQIRQERNKIDEIIKKVIT